MMKTDSDIDADYAKLNAKAFGALMGWTFDWQKDLSNLLRSDAPIGPAVRDLLADAIEQKSMSGIVLKMEGHQSQAKRIEGLKARQGWLELGDAVAPFVVEASNVARGCENASEALGSDSDKCRKRFYYTKNFRDWSHTARRQGKFYSQMSDLELQEIWHLASVDQREEIKPRPMAGAEFDRQTDSQIAFFSDAFDGWRHQKLWIETFLFFNRLVPPEKP